MKIILLALMFSIMKTNKKISDLCVKKYFQKHVDLFLLQEKDKSTILLSKILIHL